MAIDPLDYRRVLGSFATGIIIATARQGRGPVTGITINSFTSVSLRPPLVLFCIGNDSPRLPVFLAVPRIAFSILTSHQQPIAARFAQPGAGHAPAGLLKAGPDGSWLVPDSLATLVTRRQAVFSGGDHQIILCRVTHLQGPAEQGALLYFRSRYRRLRAG